MESILTSIKKLLGITEEYTHFDADIIMHINSAFFVLHQLGVGPPEGFSIKDSSAVWTEYTQDITKMELIKSYVYMKVRLMFDPPTSSAMIEAVKTQIAEFEWRILVAADSAKITG